MLMKGKAATYVLGLLVAVVWGLIIYRIIDATHEEETLVASSIVPVSKEPLNDYTMTEDTSKLQLNYRDPFAVTASAPDTVKVIPVRQLVTPAIKAISTNSNPVKPVPPAMNWGFINYTGYIKNPATKKLLALVHINGKELMLTEGESAEQVKLLKNLRDSIQIVYHGKTKYIAMNTASL
jgi:hypothetical protein